jgi:glycerol-3-phosphate dehydrogenase (NAD(P)+)
MNIAVLGAGSMGTAVANAVAGNGHSVRVWSIEYDVLEDVRDNRANSKYLPGVSLHENISASWTFEEALADAELVVLSVPSHIVRTLVRDAAAHVRPDQPVLNVAKGLEEETDKRLSEVISEELGRGDGIAAMGGPAIAAEMARGMPTAVVVASEDADLAAAVRDSFHNHFLKVDTTTDVVGVELGACLKNAYAIALGMCDGMGHGTNTKAFIATLAMNEMAALSTAMGGREATVFGLAGLGDLLTTGYSAHSRNRTLGEKLASGDDPQGFLRTNTVEGVAACQTIRLAGRFNVSAPLLRTVHDIVIGGQDPSGTMAAFMRDFFYDG